VNPEANSEVPAEPVDANPPVAPAPETVEAAAPAAPTAPVVVAKPGVPRRILEWFWGSRAMAAARARTLGPNPQVLELVRRARLASEVAQLVLEPPQPLDHGPGHAVACDLYRQAIYWTLLARRQMSQSGALEPVLEADVWRDANPVELAKEAGQPGLADNIGRAFGPKPFIDFAELSAEEQLALATQLRSVTEPILDNLESRQIEVERVWMRRAVRLGALAALLAAGVTAYALTSDMRERGADLAQGASWVASSKYPENGCTSPAQKCAESPNFFFHTVEEIDPNIIFDLKKAQSVSGVRVVNRPDCCPGRGIPLVVEVSEDLKTWKEVARRSRDFSNWRVNFPKVKARYVKLHAPNKNILHLQQVRILP
jgi:hypothetical protein